MPVRIEQECPQCAAPVELDQTDHLLECQYCNVKSFIVNPGCYRFVLPGISPDDDTIHAPYLHFKGAVYTCDGLKIQHRLSDITERGVDLPFLPISLGLRPQAMKMRFVTRERKGIFLANSVKVSDILARATKSSSLHGAKNMFHAHIGEAVNLIYLPLRLEGDTVFDAVTDNPLVQEEDLAASFAALTDNSPGWQPEFRAALCPQCGWSLDGERDSVVLFCSNCTAAWEADGSGFSQVNFSVEKGGDENDMYLPFWKITASTTGKVEIASFADFIRITNQPLSIQPSWERMNMRYLAPAFKIRPRDFLRLGTRLTVGHLETDTADFADKRNLHPVNFSRNEALQGLKLILANAAFIKVNVLPFLSEIDFIEQDFSLVYLPFSNNSHELILERLGIALNKNTLTFGRNL